MYQNYGANDVDTTAHRALSLSVAEQAMTLLKNEPPKTRTGRDETGTADADTTALLVVPCKLLVSFASFELRTTLSP